MLNLLRLARLNGDSAFEELASKTSKAFSSEVQLSPTAHTFMLLAVDFAVGSAYNVILVGDVGEGGTRNMLKTLREHYLPNTVISLRKPSRAGLGYETIGGKATAYVCRGRTCMPPTNETEQLLRLLGLS
jgi:uncharacterized protein YyaL (SSP411 family)